MGIAGAGIGRHDESAGTPTRVVALLSPEVGLGADDATGPVAIGDGPAPGLLDLMSIHHCTWPMVRSAPWEGAGDAQETGSAGAELRETDPAGGRRRVRQDGPRPDRAGPG